MTFFSKNVIIVAGQLIKVTRCKYLRNINHLSCEHAEDPSEISLTAVDIHEKKSVNFCMLLILMNINMD